MKLIVNKLAINYYTAGKGKIVLLLHGWQSDSQAFNSLAKKLSKHFRVIVPDLPGFGGSDTPGSDWNLDSYINSVNQFLMKLKVKDVYAIVGHSMGGRISLKAVGSGQLVPKKLVLIGAHGIRESRSLRNRMFWLAAKTGRAATKPLPNRYREALRRRLYRASGSTDYLAAGNLRQIFKNIIEEDVRPEAAMINTPTLLIYGKNDTVTPPHYGRIFQQLIPRARLEIVAEAGHFAHHDQAERVGQLIEQFLK